MKWWYDWGYGKVFIELEDGRKYTIDSPFSVPDSVLKRFMGLPDDFPDVEARRLAVELGLNDSVPVQVALLVARELEKFKEELLREVRNILREEIKNILKEAMRNGRGGEGGRD